VQHFAVGSGPCTGVAAVSRIAAVTASAEPVRDQAEEILDVVHRIFPFEAAIVSCVDAVHSSRSHALASRGYSAEFTEYLVGEDWHAECVAPFGVPRNGWPCREADLPVDPMSLDGIIKGRALNLNEGLLSGLVNSAGRHTGFLMLSWSENIAPSEETCAVIGQIAEAMANMIDPLRSARYLASTLDADTSAAALLGDSTIVPLRGAALPSFLSSEAFLPVIVEENLHGHDGNGFLWPAPGGGWYMCRAYRCDDDVTVCLSREVDDVHGLTPRELEVLGALVDGCSNAEIAARLWITTRTARAHVEHILQKLEVTTRAGAVGRAVGEGLRLPMGVDVLAQG
jgi:DNA-binding CsgD family transcriptional regulator